MRAFNGSGQRKRNLHSLIHDNTDSIVQQAFTEYDSVELRVDLVLLEYR